LKTAIDRFVYEKAKFFESEICAANHSRIIAKSQLLHPDPGGVTFCKPQCLVAVMLKLPLKTQLSCQQLRDLQNRLTGRRLFHC